MKRLTELDQEKEKRKLNRVTRILEIIGTVIIGLILSVFIFGKNFDYCEHALEIQSIHLNGVVKKKIDLTWNHNDHALRITNNDGQIIFFNLTHDANKGKSGQSSLWENINQGDSIAKKSGEFHVRFKKLGQKWMEENLKYDLLQCNN